MRASLELAVKLDQAIDVYPDPKPFCDVCRWQERWHDAKRRADDHLSLVAGIGKIPSAELAEHARRNCASLAAMPIPVTFKPSRGSASALERVREQARIQIEGRIAGIVLNRRLEAVQGFGLAKLVWSLALATYFSISRRPILDPALMVGLNICSATPSRGEDGQERYVADWAFSRAEDIALLSVFIDFVMNRLSLHRTCTSIISPPTNTPPPH